MARATADTNRIRAKLRGAGMLALASAALACSACRPAPASTAAAPKSLASADPIIIGVASTPKGVLVRASIAEPDLAGDSVRRASQAVRRLALAVQAGAADLPPGASVLTFEIYGVDVDKLGNRTPGRLFASDYDVNDLKTADMAATGPAKALNLAIDLRIDHAGISPINAWCMRYPHVGGNFCDMAGF